ncbi:uncharacterized protein M421DRAFT_88780 [Didymella exigua CBS 183.55]|uniref:Uncharacterized protein n=1 Tax=Didymella exigua CBS 183.55 TaxID=1150837 RepID=A0A6A5S2F8_9PLEO|nr:uncharacterized protein M421DRAFT_88780 [Didymella exigua CBS 183.55]KAF1933604.1 hypothetical protein M421DRAFT_88780 [Didymella exigua CBS 183.55]
MTSTPWSVVTKPSGSTGFAMDPSWTDLAPAQYEDIMRPAEGGGLHHLSSLLQMHTKSIRLLTEALQRQASVKTRYAALTSFSGSLSHLEGAVTPTANRFDSTADRFDSTADRFDSTANRFDSTADRVDSMYDLPGSLEDQLEQVSRFVEQLALLNPAAQAPPIPLRNPARLPTEMPGHISTAPFPLSSPASSSRRASLKTASPSAPSSISSPTSNHSPPSLAGSSPPTTPRRLDFGRPSARCSTSTYGSHTHPEPSETSRVRSTSRLSPFPARQRSITKLHRSGTTASQEAAFEKDAFRNAAVLCDVRGSLVEYSQQTQPDPDCPSDIADIEMVEACTSCRIAVVRKRIPSTETRAARFVTSIWALNSDNNVRVELKIDKGEALIPYSSYFSPAKVSTTVPCELRFHDVRFGNQLLRTARTSWVNFVFADAAGATLFQGALMGRTLLATFRTSKTMRIHDGPMAAFAYAEQMCALENLRIWEDPDSGAVIGLVHFSASFRPGYLAFYLNSSTNPVQVAESGPREVKIKGLRVPIAEAGRAMRKDSVVDDTDAVAEAGGVLGGAGKERRWSTAGVKSKGNKVEVDRKKVISGAKMEFASAAEKSGFLALVHEYQTPGKLLNGQLQNADFTNVDSIAKHVHSLILFSATGDRSLNQLLNSGFHPHIPIGHTKKDVAFRLVPNTRRLHPTKDMDWEHGTDKVTLPPMILGINHSVQLNEASLARFTNASQWLTPPRPTPARSLQKTGTAHITSSSRTSTGLGVWARSGSSGSSGATGTTSNLLTN